MSSGEIRQLNIRLPKESFDVLEVEALFRGVSLPELVKSIVRDVVVELSDEEKIT